MSRQYPKEFWLRRERGDRSPRSTSRNCQVPGSRRRHHWRTESSMWNVIRRKVRSSTALAADYGVPILMHFQHGTYNRGFERLFRDAGKISQDRRLSVTLKPGGRTSTRTTPIRTCFIPKGPVKAGGLTDRYLADYPNMFADMSAGSGLNALTRDEDHARGFLDRHQDKILFGSDCDDRVGAGAACQGSQTIAAIRKLSPNKAAERKILYENSKTRFRIAE